MRAEIPASFGTGFGNANEPNEKSTKIKANSLCCMGYAKINEIILEKHLF
jgi:hypothetical protein